MCPGVIDGIDNEFQFAHLVRPAQCASGFIVAERGCPAITNGSATVAGDDVEVINGRLTPFGMQTPTRFSNTILTRTTLVILDRHRAQIRT